MPERPFISRTVPVVLAVVMLALWLAPVAAAAPPNGTPDAPSRLRDRATGTIVGQSGGAFAYYVVSLQAGGAPARVEMTFSSADGSAVRAAGAKVYGTTSGKEYASLAPTRNGETVAAEFAPGENGDYLIQAFNYAPVAVDFALAVSGPRPAISPRTIVVDPGHGGPEIGAADGGVIEKQVNLQIALRLAALLRSDGHKVILTHDADSAVSPIYTSSRVANGLRSDLQARIDVANAAHADLFICIHNNGGPAAQSGTEVWFNRARPFAAKNQLLAELTQKSLLEHIRALGYPVRDRGLKPDDHFSVINGQDYNLFVLGPDRATQRHTPTQMPGILGESLFISNPGDVAMLRQERTLDAIAAGYRDAIDQYFATN
jgi:N-acetylmuramoyl-L-alanine amidase